MDQSLQEEIRTLKDILKLRAPKKVQEEVIEQQLKAFLQDSPDNIRLLSQISTDMQHVITHFIDYTDREGEGEARGEKREERPNPEPETPNPEPFEEEEMEEHPFETQKIRLKKNAMVGVDYHYQLDLASLKESYELYSLRLAGYEKYGLQFDLETGILAGTPPSDAAGNQLLGLYYRTEEEGEEKFKEISLIINPDPKSLWQNNEPDPDSLYPISHTDHLYLEQGGFRLQAASRRGRSHAHAGGFRDDAIALDFLAESGWAILAVADGAGSAPYARRGSELACVHALEGLKAHLAAGSLDEVLSEIGEEDIAENTSLRAACYTALVENAAWAAVEAIKAEAEKIEAETRDFSTTLLLTICKKVKAAYFFASFWVGDGAVGIYTAGAEAPLIMGTPDGGEFAGQTRFLTSREVWQDGAIADRVYFHLVKDFTACILMTDGVSDPRFETDAGLLKQENWDSLWDELPEAVKSGEGAPEALLQWLDFWAVGHHDDRSIAILRK